MINVNLGAESPTVTSTTRQLARQAPSHGIGVTWRSTLELGSKFGELLILVRGSGKTVEKL